MAHCDRPDLNERLMEALWPEDSGPEAEEIARHAEECPVCRKELEMMRSMNQFLTDHRNELANAVAPCPEPAILIAYAEGEEIDPIIKAHIDGCDDCTRELLLLQELARERPEPETGACLTAEDRIVVQNAMKNHYRGAASGPEKPTQSWLRRLTDFLHVPSLALGAVAATALVLVIVMPATSPDGVRLALSDARWNIPDASTTKGGGLFEPADRKSVALVLLLGENANLTREQIDTVYRSITIPPDIAQSYLFISPEDLNRRLGPTVSRETTVKAIAEQVFQAFKPEYVLTAVLENRGDKPSLSFQWFKAHANNRVASFAQQNIDLENVPTLIGKWAGAVLLLELTPEPGKQS